jgi:hypothetical protein
MGCKLIKQPNGDHSKVCVCGCVCPFNPPRCSGPTDVGMPGPSTQGNHFQSLRLRLRLCLPFNAQMERSGPIDWSELDVAAPSQYGYVWRRTLQHWKIGVLGVMTQSSRVRTLKNLVCDFVFGLSVIFGVYKTLAFPPFFAWFVWQLSYSSQNPPEPDVVF